MLGGALGVADQIQFNYTTLPTFATTSIGYIYNYTMPASISAGGNTLTIAVPKGIYIAFSYIEVVTAQTSGFFHELQVAGVRQALSFAPTGGSFQYLTAISTPCSCSAASTNISIYINCIVATNLLTGCKFYVTRIA